MCQLMVLMLVLLVVDCTTRHGGLFAAVCVVFMRMMQSPGDAPGWLQLQTHRAVWLHEAEAALSVFCQLHDL
jgi:hypothetical protein